jgi:hypothetical protein
MLYHTRCVGFSGCLMRLGIPLPQIFDHPIAQGKTDEVDGRLEPKFIEQSGAIGFNGFDAEMQIAGDLPRRENGHFSGIPGD